MSTRDRQQIDALTSLRFFAAFYVLIFHSGGPSLRTSGVLPEPVANFLANGYLGVPFFFILSGFILTHVYHGRLGSGEAVRRYAWARFARVYPVFFLSLLLMMPFVPDTGLRHVLPQFFLLQSWIPLSLSDGTYTANWNMQAWTLSVELLFYVSFPLLLLNVQSWSRGAVLAAIVACCGLMVAFRLPEIRGADSLLYPAMRYIPFPLLRLPEFTFGVMLGALFRRGDIPSSRLGLYAAMAATIAVLSVSPSPWVAPPAAILFGAIIALTPTSLEPGVARSFLTHPAMVLLGGASYGIYVLQLPVHLIVGAAFDGPYAIVGKLAYFPILIGVSILAFLMFEEPMRRLINGLAKSRTARA